MIAILIVGGGLHPVTLTPLTPNTTEHETPAKAARQAHRWLRRRVATPGEWAVILHTATGEVCKRYMLRNGRVERMQ